MGGFSQINRREVRLPSQFAALANLAKNASPWPIYLDAYRIARIVPTCVHR